MTVFVSGPMRGYEDYNHKAFNDMQKKLEDFGYVVLNPASLPINLSDEKYLPICISMLEQCDGIVLLHGWKNSRGSNAERAYAYSQGKIILEEI